MRRNPGLETGDPTVVPEDREVLIAEMSGPCLGDLSYRCPLSGVGQPDARIDQTMGRGIAARPAEDEEDGGKHPLLSETFHGLDPVRALETPPPPSLEAEHVLD